MIISILKNVNVIVCGLLLAGSLNLGVFGLVPLEGSFSPAVIFGRLVYMTAGMAAIYVISGQNIFRNYGAWTS